MWPEKELESLKPTGNPNCPPLVKRAKQIMQSIEGNLDFEETQHDYGTRDEFANHNDVDHFFDNMNAATQFNPDQTEEMNSLLSYAGGNSIEGV
jgi:hypothetical protein